MSDILKDILNVKNNLTKTTLRQKFYCVRTNEDEAEELPGVGDVTKSVQTVHHDLEPPCWIRNKRFNIDRTTKFVFN